MAGSSGNTDGLRALFFMHYRCGDIINSIITGEKLLLAYRLTKKSDSAEYAEISFYVASLYDRVGRFDRALYHYVKCVGATEKSSGLCVDLAERMNNLAVCYGRLNKAEDALAFFIETLKMRRFLEGGDNEETAINLYNLGSANYDCGNYNEAVVCFNEALKWFRGNRRIDCLNSLGYCYEKLQDYGQAVRYLEDALSLIHEAEGESEDYLANMMYLAQLNGVNKDMEKMYFYNKKSLDLIGKFFSKQHPYYAGVLSHMAEYFVYKNEHIKAINMRIRALNILKKSLGKNFMYHANSLKNLAIALFAVSDSKRGAKIFKEALSIKEVLIGINSDEYIFDATLFFSFMLEAGRYEEIIKAGKKLAKADKLNENGIYGGNFKAFYGEIAKLCSENEDGGNGDLQTAHTYLNAVNDCALSEIKQIINLSHNIEINSEGGTN